MHCPRPPVCVGSSQAIGNEIHNPLAGDQVPPDPSLQPHRFRPAIARRFPIIAGPRPPLLVSPLPLPRLLSSAGAPIHPGLKCILFRMTRGATPKRPLAPPNASNSIQTGVYKSSYTAFPGGVTPDQELALARVMHSRAVLIKKTAPSTAAGSTTFIPDPVQPAGAGSPQRNRLPASRRLR
jgi:hypothetical protein